MAAAQAAAAAEGAGSSSWGLGSGVFDTSGPRIKVVVRKRPMSKKELALAELDAVRIGSKRGVQVHEIKRKVDLTK